MQPANAGWLTASYKDVVDPKRVKHTRADDTDDNDNVADVPIAQNIALAARVLRKNLAGKRDGRMDTMQAQRGKLDGTHHTSMVFNTTISVNTSNTVTIPGR